MIKAIIFDFFGVICSDEYWSYIKDEGTVGSEFLTLADEVCIGKISWKQFIDKIAEKTGKTEQELLDGYASQKLNPQLLALIEKLHGRYKTAILSNANRETFNLLTKDVPLKTIFNDVFISSDIGMIKPDPKIYQYALARLKVLPEETIFIDDSSKYIYSAKEVGLNTILYHDFGQMKAELVRILSREKE